MKIDNEEKLFNLLKEKQKYLDDLIKTKDNSYKIEAACRLKGVIGRAVYSLNISESITTELIEFLTIKINNKLKEIDNQIQLL